MKKKVLLCLILMVLLVLLLSVAFATPAPVTNLKAKGGFNNVTLSWNPSPQAQGYIIYRKQGSESFKYLYMVSKTSYTDHSASSKSWNFYRIYPYRMVGNKRIVGPSTRYVYGKATYFPPVSNLKATGEKARVRLTWKGSPLADGYIIYKREIFTEKPKFKYLSMTKQQSYVDFYASIVNYNFYRVYPYKMVNGQRIVGPSNRYVYAEALYGYDETTTGLKVTPGLDYCLLTWDKTRGADGYSIFRAQSWYPTDLSNLDFDFLAEVNTNAYKDYPPYIETMNGPYPACNYYYVVPFKRMLNDWEDAGKRSNYAYAKPRWYEKSVTNLIGISPQKWENGKIYVKWDPVPGAHGYHVEWYRGEYHTKATTIIKSGLNPNEIYYFKIRPYIINNGYISYGEGMSYGKGWVDIRPYKKPDTYYTGRYEIGKHIPAGKYLAKVDSDENSFISLHSSPENYMAYSVYKKVDLEKNPIITLKAGELVDIYNAVLIKK